MRPSRSASVLLTALAAFALGPSFARAETQPDVEGCKDDPAVQRLPGTFIEACEYEEFGKGTLYTDADGEPKVAEGEVRSITYSGRENVSKVQLRMNYEAAFKKAGFQIVRMDDSDVVGRVKRNGADLWVALSLGYGGDRHTFTIVRTKQVAQEVEVSADGLLAALEQAGRIAVYGILFDTGRATIKTESEKVLVEVRKLLANNASIKLRIEGHTDNVGAKSDNVALSKKRAEAVKGWLVGKGVGAARLTTDGLGDTVPVADNATDEGKAKNRRVELVKL